MAIPCLDIQHLKTSRQHEETGLQNHYLFQWQNRRQLGPVVLQLDLLDARGKVITTSRTKLPKVRVTSYVPATATQPSQPLYDSSVFVEIDDVVPDELPTTFRYRTISGAFKKSDVVSGPMNGTYED